MGRKWAHRLTFIYSHVHQLQILVIEDRIQEPVVGVVQFIWILLLHEAERENEKDEKS